MTERFPEQRNRSAQRRADAHQVPDDASSAFDESFVAAAPVREPSARARALSARRAAQLPDDRLAFRPADQPAARWAVRPSHHLAALRLPAVAGGLSVIAISALLFILLR